MTRKELIAKHEVRFILAHLADRRQREKLALKFSPNDAERSKRLRKRGDRHGPR